MLPYKTLIAVDKQARLALYLQIANAFIQQISAGVIAGGTKLPGSRTLAKMLTVNRRTVIAAYDELSAQGWVEVKPNQGCFVSSAIPVVHPQSLGLPKRQRQTIHTHFVLTKTFDHLEFQRGSGAQHVSTVINDGYPDVRLAPLDALAKNLSFIMRSPQAASLMSYTQAYKGDVRLREQLITYLAETRSIVIPLDNIMITRGSLMAFYLLFQTLLEPGDAVIVGEPGFNEGHNTITLAKGHVLRVPVDAEGLDLDAVEALCKKRPIRAVYIIPHHHYPTTVSLSAARRMRLLMLADRYRFAIIEDDYDYDFHYSSSPILPIASSDYAGVVAYVGSFSKTVAPSLRIGFVIAPANLIDQMARLSKFIDSHGNTAMERAIAMLFESGDLRRHLKKALNVYRDRRDHFCDLLRAELGNHVMFDLPEGGLATWVRFNEQLSLEHIVVQAVRHGLRIPDSSLFCPPSKRLNATRMGFASLTKSEMQAAIHKLRASVEVVERQQVS